MSYKAERAAVRQEEKQERIGRLSAATDRALTAEEKDEEIAALRSWHETAAQSIERLGALIEDIRIGAEQQSQSHADVLAKIAQFRTDYAYGEQLRAGRIAQLERHGRALLDAAEHAHMLLCHYYIMRRPASPGIPEGVDWGDPHELRHEAVDKLWSAIEPARDYTAV